MRSGLSFHRWRNSSPFVEPKDSVPCSEEPVTVLCPNSFESDPYPIFSDYFIISFSARSSNGIFDPDFRTEFVHAFLIPALVLHVPPISASLILSRWWRVKINFLIIFSIILFTSCLRYTVSSHILSVLSFSARDQVSHCQTANKIIVVFLNL